MCGRVSTEAASYGTLFSFMTHECTYVTNIEELTICCSSCVVNRGPEEHLIEILNLKKANAKSIYLVEYCREMNIPLGRFIGIGFDGAAAFSCDKTGVHRRLIELSPQVLFVHCHLHFFQLASVQATNATQGIKHVYSTLMTYTCVFITLQNMQSLKCCSKITRTSRAQDL